ncbi:hypothetical protein [Pleomorphochaeta sp. DL1XJH-081]|uniref:hypothetical protein n=1 Tax=Pleomorphochaeta sp. DL1XJH-081 TaxID=3409690 RepID=UPI003BB5AC11
MDCRLAKGYIPFVAGVVLLVSLLFNSCASTQQETDAALQYSPTYEDLENSPLSVPDGAAGYGRVYELWAVEDFSTMQRGPGRGFELGEIGSFPTEEHDRWIIGYSTGKEKFLQYYRTDPHLIPLTPRGRYELRFNYKVLETPDEGFEVLFYSETGSSRDDWVEQSMYINEPAGSKGEAVMAFQLKDYSDYRLLMNVINKGKIAVTDIRIKDLKTGAIVACEDTTSALPIHSPYVTVEGNHYIGKSSIAGATNSIYLNGWAKLSTKPSMVDLPEDVVLILEFDWKLLRNGKNHEYIGYVNMYNSADADEERNSINIPGFEIDGGHFICGLKTGEKDIPYVIDLRVLDGVSIEIANIEVSLQRPENRTMEDHPAQLLASTAYPRLGNIQFGFTEWIAPDGGGTQIGDKPLMNSMELERRLAFYDIVVGLHPRHSTNDPAVSLRLRQQNPDIVLLPKMESHSFGIDKWMIEQYANPLASAEVLFPEGIEEDWYLRDPKGNVLNESKDYHDILLNVSPFCPYNAEGQKYLDYWASAVMDLHVEDGTWDGLFLDQFKTSTHDGIPGAYTSTKIKADYNRNFKKDETLIWAHEMTASASLTMLRSLRKQFGFNEIILTGPSFDQTIAPLTNGVAITYFNNAWYLTEDRDMYSEAQWCWNLYNCWRFKDLYAQPSIIVLQATPIHPNWDVPEDKREPEEQDLDFQRFAIGSALLTDAFYEFDLGDMRSTPFFFDEMLVDDSGRSTHDFSGKGWLGQALGPAEEIVRNKVEVVAKPEPSLLGNKGTKSRIVYKGRNTDSESRQFVMEFDYEILETTSTITTIGVTVDDKWRDYFDLSGLLKGSNGHVQFHTTVNPKDEIIYRMNVGKKGVVEIRNLTVTMAESGVFRRDFEHGIVLVNATDMEREISLDDISGSLARSNIRRIKGILDTETNSGKPILGTLVLPPHDAIVLLAD